MYWVKQFKWTVFLTLFTTYQVIASNVVFNPSAPTVEVNRLITLSVSGTAGEVTWYADKGKIEVYEYGSQVAYTAPAEAGEDIVTVSDQESQYELKITILPSSENITWEIYTNRDSIYEILFSEEGKTLWVSTNGGLEQRDGITGELKRVFTNLDGLPVTTSEFRGGFGVFWLVNDGQEGIWMKGANGSLVHCTAEGQITVLTTENSQLPDNIVSSLISDHQDGFWAIVGKNALVHYTTPDQWQLFNITDSGLSEDILNNVGVYYLYNDLQGGGWINIDRNFIHYNAQGQWIALVTEQDIIKDVYDPEGVQGIESVLVNKQGLWIETSIGARIAHYDTQGKLITVFKDTDLPNGVSLRFLDEQGRVVVKDQDNKFYYYQDGWVAFEMPFGIVDSPSIEDSQGGLWWDYSWRGLYSDEVESFRYRSPQGEWKTVRLPRPFNLPTNDVYALLNDGQGGVWIQTDRKNDRFDDIDLTHFSATKEWTIFRGADTGLSPNPVAVDGQTRLWTTSDSGLVNWSDHGSLTLTTTNSGLPSNIILTVSPDDRGGLWVGTDSGLAHLTFSRKTQLCQQSQDETTCESLRKGNRAAIIVAGGGAQRSNTLWDTTESITNDLYRTLAKRGFDNDEIYYVSPKSWADFNGDGRDDFIVDAPKPEAPLTTENIRTAFNWAKQRGSLNQPLYVFFVDHGAVDKLQLSEVEKLGVSDLKALLDDYQATVDNEMVVVIDACYSGVLVEQLMAPKRALISSTGNSLAYFERTERQGFSRFLAKGLDKGMPFMEAFTYANHEQQKLLGDMSKLLTGSMDTGTSLEQVPQYHDGNNGTWLSHLYLNNIALVTGDDTLAIATVTPVATVQAGEPVLLQAKTSGATKQVWAVLRPPKLNLLLDNSGTPILAYPRIDLEQTATDPELWQVTWSDAVYNGTYQLTFYAGSSDGDTASSEQNMILTVIGGIDPPDQAQVQIHIEKDRYQRGERFTAQLTEQLNWGYDLYAAVVLPDGNFLALKNTNELYRVNEAKRWLKTRQQNEVTSLLDLTLPEDLPIGQYCLYGILSPQQQEVLDTKTSWVWKQKCFEVF